MSEVERLREHGGELAGRKSTQIGVAGSHWIARGRPLTDGDVNDPGAKDDNVDDEILGIKGGETAEEKAHAARKERKSPSKREFRRVESRTQVSSDC